MSIKKNRELMVEQIKRLRGELKESVNEARMKEDDFMDRLEDYASEVIPSKDYIKKSTRDLLKQLIGSMRTDKKAKALYTYWSKNKGKDLLDKMGSLFESVNEAKNPTKAISQRAMSSKGKQLGLVYDKSVANNGKIQVTKAQIDSDVIYVVSTKFPGTSNMIMQGYSLEKDALKHANDLLKVLKESINEGGFDPEADYFDQQEYIPKKVDKVLSKHDFRIDDSLAYKEAEKTAKALKKVGWSVDYDLSGDLFDLRPIGKYDPFKDESINEAKISFLNDKLINSRIQKSGLLPLLGDNNKSLSNDKIKFTQELNSFLKKLYKKYSTLPIK